MGPARSGRTLLAIAVMAVGLLAGGYATPNSTIHHIAGLTGSRNGNYAITPASVDQVASTTGSRSGSFAYRSPAS
jgi:hypothetical protein